MPRLHSSRAPGYKIANTFERLSLEKREPLGHIGGRFPGPSPRDLEATPAMVQGDLGIVYVDTRSWNHPCDAGFVNKYSKGSFVKSDHV